MFVKVDFPGFVLVFLSGCAVMQKNDYSRIDQFNVEANLPSFNLIVTDNRPYVLSGDKSNRFTGLTRNAYGMPFSNTTKSGEPLADDLRKSITLQLNQAGKNVHGSVEKYAMNIILLEWKTDAFVNANFSYDLETHLLVNGKKSIEIDKVSGNYQLKDGETLATAVTKVLEQLFSDEKIAQEFRL